MSEIRTPPLPDCYYRAQKGRCRWCGDPILFPPGHKRAGDVNERRTWHAPCVTSYKLHTDRDTQIRFLLKRDGPCCADCGVDMTTVIGWQPQTWSIPRRQAMATSAWWSKGSPEREIYGGPYCPIVERPIGMEVDHEIPLWKVDKTKPDAMWFWGPGNLKLRCASRRQDGADIVGCHARKTGREAAERAKIHRLSGKTKRRLEPLPF